MSRMSKKIFITDDDYDDIPSIPSIPSGLRYIENCFGDDDEKKLVGFLDSCEWKSLSESKNSRKVQHYGYIYDYKSGKTTQKTRSIPDEFTFLIDILKRETHRDFNQVIVNNYDEGQGISAHTDVKEYGEVIGCYTICGGTTMRFTRESDKYELYTKPKSLYIMTGESRYKWKHEMQAKKSDVVDGIRIKRGRRISITFRYVKD